MFRYFAMFILLTLIGYLYEKYKLKYEPDEELKKYDMVKHFLLNGDSIFGNKPLLWIHSSHPINHRWWPSFNSRNTKLLNQPYKISCVETIIKYCSDSFHICLIDDQSFSKLIPNWSINMEKIGNPVKSHIRSLALSKLLYSFGGILLPNSTIVNKNLKPLYDNALKSHDFFCVNMINHGDTYMKKNIFPNNKIMGCKKNSPIMKEFLDYLERLIATDYTSEQDFLKQPNRWLYEKYITNKLFLVAGHFFGIIDAQGQEVNIDRLMNNTYIEFSPDKYAIYIPDNELLKRTKYQWFSRLSQQQLRNCETIIAKQLLIAQG